LASWIRRPRAWQLAAAKRPDGSGRRFEHLAAAFNTGQSVELAPVYVMLAVDSASYASGATMAVTGGVPFI
jgi:hypothetical protein